MSAAYLGVYNMAFETPHATILTIRPFINTLPVIPTSRHNLPTHVRCELMWTNVNCKFSCSWFTNSQVEMSNTS